MSTLIQNPASAVNQVRKRDGRTVPFTQDRINHAIEMAFRAEIGVPYPDPIAATVSNRIQEIGSLVTEAVATLVDDDGAATVEAIQDEVERQLMAAGAFQVARR